MQKFVFLAFFTLSSLASASYKISIFKDGLNEANTSVIQSIVSEYQKTLSINNLTQAKIYEQNNDIIACLASESKAELKNYLNILNGAMYDSKPIIASIEVGECE